MFCLPCCTLHVKDTWWMFIDKTLIISFSLVLWENQIHLESIKKQLALRELLLGDTQVMTWYLSFLRKSRIKHLIGEFFSSSGQPGRKKKKKNSTFFHQEKLGLICAKLVLPCSSLPWTTSYWGRSTGIEQSMHQCFRERLALRSPIINLFAWSSSEPHQRWASPKLGTKCIEWSSVWDRRVCVGRRFI